MGVWNIFESISARERKATSAKDSDGADGEDAACADWDFAQEELMKKQVPKKNHFTTPSLYA